jgi:small-conductance mechanosensitive channel
MSIAMASLAELIRGYFNLNQLASEIVASVIVFASAIVVGWAVYLIFERYFTRWAEKTKTKIDDVILRNIKAPVYFLVVLIGAYYGLDTLTFLQPYSALLTAIFTVAEILLVTFIIARVTNVLVDWYAEKSTKRGKRRSEHILFLFKKLTQVAIYVFAFLVVLAVFKIDLSGVVVGLGVGGIAIALALQTLLSDAFSAFSIYFDKPFEIGDFIVVGNYSGTVKKIGLKSTRLQLLQGEELVLSNKELTTASVRNFKNIRKRRIVFTLGVTCDTPLKKLRKIPDIISGIMEKTELAKLERVHFKEFGDFSLNFEVVYYMKVGDYIKYMDTRQEINFAIIEAFEKEGIETAFPTQTIFLDRSSSKK